MPLAQPLKWHGGKYYLAKRIIALMPPHLHYVEPYFGGGAVLLARDPARDWYAGAEDAGDKPLAKFRGCSEVVNDLNQHLSNFWRVLQDDESFAEFSDRCQRIPFSDVEFQRARAYDEPVEPPDVTAALAFFVRYRQSRQGLGKDFATLSRNRTRRTVNEQAASWMTAVEGLADIHARLRAVVVFNEDALRVIRREDGPRTLFYLDPPYLHETRVTTRDYACEMSVEAHEELLDALVQLEGKFLLSGYRSQLYDRHARQHGWRRIDIPIDNKASNKKVKDQEVECLWLNYDPPESEESAESGPPEPNRPLFS